MMLVLDKSLSMSPWMYTKEVALMCLSLDGMHPWQVPTARNSVSEKILRQLPHFTRASACEQCLWAMWVLSQERDGTLRESDRLTVGLLLEMSGDIVPLLL